MRSTALIIAAAALLSVSGAPIASHPSGDDSHSSSYSVRPPVAQYRQVQAEKAQAASVKSYVKSLGDEVSFFFFFLSTFDFRVYIFYQRC